MLAYVQYCVNLAIDPTLSFGNCYMYGTSTANQRIESWWNQVSRQLLFRWRVGSNDPMHH
jgi:hypothetical protein